MTYCVGLMVDGGLVVAADTRTNAGVDHIATFRKLTTFDKPGERIIALAGAGNLATTQAVVSLLRERAAGRARAGNLMRTANLFHAARVVGETLREVGAVDGDYVRQQGGEVSASFLVAGQVKGEAPRLFHIYDAGNFMEATPDTPYLQIGETKYGKPIIDRAVRTDLKLDEAAKLALLSFDSTMRSNLSVGPPITLWCYEKNTFAPGKMLEFAETDSYFQYLRKGYSEGILKIVQGLPNPAGL